jgi:hypothetical protein
MLTQNLRQNLKERHLFQNDGWTKWEAVQLVDALEAKQAMAKADWECWRKLGERFEQIHGLFSFDLDDDDQEQACQNACTRERCNSDVSQMAKEMNILPYFLSPSPQQHGSHTKTSANSKRKGKGGKGQRKP